MILLWNRIRIPFWLDRNAYLPRVPTERNGSSNPDSLTRLICGGLILPTIATIFGKFMFQRVHSNFQRTLLVIHWLTEEIVFLLTNRCISYFRVVLRSLFWKAFQRFIINKVNIFVKRIVKFSTMKQPILHHNTIMSIRVHHQIHQRRPFLLIIWKIQPKQTNPLRPLHRHHQWSTHRWFSFSFNLSISNAIDWLLIMILLWSFSLLFFCV